MPLILGTNSIKDTGYDVANSLRFDDGSSDYIYRNFSADTEKNQITCSFWIKRGNIGSTQRILSHMTSGFADYFYIRFESDEKLHFHAGMSSGSLQFDTTQVFRDNSAWSHIVIAMDTTQGTDTNRVKIYVNGVQLSNFDTSIYPNQNATASFGKTDAPIVVGGLYGAGYGIGSGSPQEFYDGYISEIVFIDGQQLTADSFGEFDQDSGIWKPIDVSGLTFGTNGFYLDFENSGSLGADVSGNGNNFTVNNLTSVDQSSDTCTNNFATGNNLANFYPNSTFSEGNLKIVTDSSPYTYNIATIGVSSGKWFWEVKYVSATGDPHNLGIFGISGKGDPDASNHILGYYSTDYGITNNELYNNNSATSNSLYAISIGDKLGFALDLDSGTNTLKFYRNGTEKITTNISSSPESGFYFPAVGFSYSAGQGTFEFNFGSPPYSESGGNSDGNGYGNFSMAVPSGYYALNTKNLAEYG